MIDKQTGDHFIDQVVSNWISPELKKRALAGTILESFELQRCLIRMPFQKPAIVEFNEEVNIIANLKVRMETSYEKDDILYLPDYDGVESVEAPQVDGVRVAFIYVWRSKKGYACCFDFLPNHRDLENYEELMAASK
jgi:hypothetical protein